MTKLTGSNFTNISEMTVQNDISVIIIIIINAITCPFTVVLNVLVIMAVKRRRRLQSRTNILLACLAATDAVTGLVVQPSLIVWKTFNFLNFNGIESSVASDFHKFCLRSLTVCSSLHLILITFERLIAIKFTMSYPHIVTKRKIEVAVIVCWAFSFMSQGIRYTSFNSILRFMTHLILSLAMTFCVLFNATTYAILYRESRRHESQIKTQQLPQEEAARFVKENKALKTTVLVVGAVLLCFLPMIMTLSLFPLLVRVKLGSLFVVSKPLGPNCAILNSLLNPLIYCLRQKEMRKFVFQVPWKPVGPAMN